MPHETIGKRIRRIRLERDKSLADLSAAMILRGHKSLTDRRLSEIENGKRQVKVQELISFARVLDVAITKLLGVPDYASE
jgi:transcriptional regulator with XRE-family HTH domain